VGPGQNVDLPSFDTVHRFILAPPSDSGSARCGPCLRRSGMVARIRLPDEGSACSTKGRWPPERLVGTKALARSPSSPPTTSLQKMRRGAVGLPWHRRALAYGPASQGVRNTAVFEGVSIAGPRLCPEGRTERAV